MLSDFIQNQGANFPTQEEAQGPNVGVDPCLFLTSDPKPRLRWSAELHNRFVDAVTQLGGPGKATPKSIMRTMGVKGLTLYHLKSHLQKYRIGKQSGGESIEQPKDVPSLQGTQGLSNSAPPVPTPDVNEGHEVEEALRAQMEVQRKLHEQLEVQKCLERFVDAESRYVQSLLERACQLVAKASTSSTSPGNWGQGVSELDVKEVLNFPCYLPSSPSVHQLPMERVGVHSPKEPPNQRQDLTTCFTQGSSTSQQNPVRLSVEGFQTQSRKRMRSPEYGPESLIWEVARTKKTYVNVDHTDCHGDLNFLNVIGSDERVELEGNNKAVTMEYLSPDAELDPTSSDIRDNATPYGSSEKNAQVLTRDQYKPDR